MVPKRIPTISESAAAFLDMTGMTRSQNTYRSYKNALKVFLEILEEHNLDPDDSPVSNLSEEAISWLLKGLKAYTPATEQLYTIAATRFYQYLMAESLTDINLQKLQLIVRNRSRKPGQRLPQFPKEDIDTVLEYAEELPAYNYETDRDRLIAHRDAALILSLADTGLRIHEICNLRRGDLDWNEYKAIIVGKGDRQAVVRFSSRSIRAIKAYLEVRSKLDGTSGRALTSLPIFSRHDKGAGSKVLPITTTTGRNIIKQRTKEILGEEASSRISPHSFRHFFVTNVLRGSGGNLKLAQELARHKNIQVTQRYAHLSDDELDEGYHQIFEE
jgi:integrase/recombinase XerC